MPQSAKTILDVLLEEKKISVENAELVLKEQKETGINAETILLQKKLVSEESVALAKGKLFGLPFYDLEGKKLTREILLQIPREAAEYYKIIPLEMDVNRLKVGMVNPEDIKAREAVKFIALRGGFKIEIYIVTLSQFQETVKAYESLGGEVSKALLELEEEIKKERKKTREETVEEKIVESAPITKLVAVILNYASGGKASDIHLEPTEIDLRVRFRVDGILYTSLVLPIKVHRSVVSRIKILANLKIDETRIPQDGRFQAKIGDRFIDFRISTLPTIYGEKVVMRILDPSVGLQNLKYLGLEGRNLKLVEENMDRSFGLILITGPTGSGKSTTLYSILNRLNKEELNIVTLEDPVEYYIDKTNQSQIKPEIGYTFASGLRHIVRQDPDVIMVGEIRDSETASLAIHAALTGHLVFSTLHTNDAVGAIPRLVDMGVEAFLLPSTLILAIAQRLVRRLCQECKQKIKPQPQIEEIIKEVIEKIPEKVLEDLSAPTDIVVYKSVGCKACGGKGTKGRIGIFEVLSMTPELESLILEGLSETKLQAEAKRQGMTSMKEDGIIKALKGFVSVEEVLKTVNL